MDRRLRRLLVAIGVTVLTVAITRLMPRGWAPVYVFAAGGVIALAFAIAALTGALQAMKRTLNKRDSVTALAAMLVGIYWVLVLPSVLNTLMYLMRR